MTRNREIRKQDKANFKLQASSFFFSLNLILILLIVRPLYADIEPLQLIKAGEMNHVTKDDSSYIHLRKDVRFKKGNIFIHSEEAFNYEEDNLLLLKNNVHIQDGNKEFFGEQVFYDTETDQIRIPDKSQMIFEGKSLQAGIIRANLENDIITAIGEVVVSDSGTIIHCDTLTYFEKEKEAHIQGKGHIRDKKEKISLLSDLFYYNLDTEHIFSGLPAQIIQQDSLGKDVFTLDAGFISAFMEDKRFIAEDSVVIFQDSLQAFCDSFYYASLEDRGSLHKNPLIVQKENKISGTDMYLLFNEKSIDHVDIIGNARTENIQIGYLKRDSIETPIPKISHLTGLRLLVQLEDNELSTLRMQGMAASDYHVFEDSVYQGLNASSGDTVVMDFKDGELKEIAILEGARGTYYPNQEAVSMDTTIVYSSDRIFYRIDNRQTRLVKNAGLIFGEMTLRADTIMVNWNTNMLLALPEITDTGLVHLPEMEQKGDNPLVGEKLEYNLKTRRGKITQGKTKLDDGYYQGEKILNRSKDAFFVKDGRYSTCDRPEPHFWIESRYMKMIPKDKVFARPLILKIQGIPIFALPFGFFPTKGGGRQSGWLMPSYGYRSASGRFLKDGGYYWAPNDYFDTRFTMNFYDKWGILSSLNTRYVLRYKLNGTIAVKYKKYFIDQHSTSYDINIRHSQTIGKSSRLNVSGSYTNDRSFYNTTGITLDERLKQKLISNATYSTRIGALSFQSNLSRTEDLVSGNVNATLPNISISKGSAPLFKASSSSAKKWYNNFTYNTGSRFSNTYSHILQSDSSYVDNTKNGIISSASLKYSGKAFKWLSLSPSVNYKDGLVFKYNAPVLENGQLTYNDDGSLAIEEINDLKRRGTYNFSMSANTKLYGIFQLPATRLQAVRHVLSPSLSYRYTPDFSQNENNVYRTLDSLGNEVSFDYFNGSYIGSTGSRESQSMNFSLGNSFAAKILGKDGKAKKYDFLTLNLSSSYNFKADSMRLSPYRVSYRASKLPGNLNFSGSLRLDPYKFDTVSGRRVDEFLAVPRMTSFSFDTGFQLKEKKKKTETQVDSSMVSDNKDSKKENTKDGFSSWAARMGIRYNYSATNPDNTNKSLNLSSSFSANLTQYWKISYRANYNLIEQRLLNHHITLNRDLHCWSLKFDWTPSGPGQGYFLLIQVKAPSLQDLKIQDHGGRSVFY